MTSLIVIEETLRDRVGIGRITEKQREREREREKKERKVSH